MIFVRLNSLSITYILAPAPSPPLLLLCCTCREKLFTQTTKLVGPILASGTMGVNSTVGSYDGDILHARQMHYIHLPSRGSFIAQEPLFLVWAHFSRRYPLPTPALVSF